MGKGKGHEGGGGLGREQGACSACSTFFRGLREISSFVHNQGRGFKAPAKWFISEKDVFVYVHLGMYFSRRGEWFAISTIATDL